MTNHARDGLIRQPTTVFVDAEPFSWKWFAGVPRYTARIAMALAKRGPIRFFDGDHEIIPPPNLTHDHSNDLETWARRIWTAERRPLPEDRGNSVGVYGGFRTPKRRFPREVGVLYDFCPLLVGWTFPDAARWSFEKYYAEDILASDAVISISHASKADAAWLCPMPQDRIEVAPTGPSQCVEKHQHSGEVKRLPHVGIAVSTVEPRKNAPFVLDWFHQSRVLPPEAELWWVGKMGWLVSPEELQAMTNPPGGRKVKFLGTVSDAELCKLYRQASWSIYASMYEGFGFPVLDSLMHGTPVMTAYNSSMREFQYKGVSFFDACDPGTADEAWLALRKGKFETATRTELARFHDWDKVAELILSLSSPGGPRRDPPSSELPKSHLTAFPK